MRPYFDLRKVTKSGKFWGTSRIKILVKMLKSSKKNLAYENIILYF